VLKLFFSVFYPNYELCNYVTNEEPEGY